MRRVKYVINSVSNLSAFDRRSKYISFDSWSLYCRLVLQPPASFNKGKRDELGEGIMILNRIIKLGALFSIGNTKLTKPTSIIVSQTCIT